MGIYRVQWQTATPEWGRDGQAIPCQQPVNVLNLWAMLWDGPSLSTMWGEVPGCWALCAHSIYGRRWRFDNAQHGIAQKILSPYLSEAHAEQSRERESRFATDLNKFKHSRRRGMHTYVVPVCSLKALFSRIAHTFKIISATFAIITKSSSPPPPKKKPFHNQPMMLSVISEVDLRSRVNEFEH